LADFAKALALRRSRTLLNTVRSAKLTMITGISEEGNIRPTASVTRAVARILERGLPVIVSLWTAPAGFGGRCEARPHPVLPGTRRAGKGPLGGTYVGQITELEQPFL